MLIKSRHCAGSAALSDDFMKMIRPFVYRRTMDISVLEEIGRIKGRINQNLKGADAATRNVKLGEGGIREIEFITQALQLGLFFLGILADTYGLEFVFGAIGIVCMGSLVAFSWLPRTEENSALQQAAANPGDPMR